MPKKPCAKSSGANGLTKPPPGNTPTQSRGRATPIRDTFQVVIQCASEEEQEQLYREFRARNLQVRLLTM